MVTQLVILSLGFVTLNQPDVYWSILTSLALSKRLNHFWRHILGDTKYHIQTVMDRRNIWYLHQNEYKNQIAYCPQFIIFKIAIHYVTYLDMKNTDISGIYFI